MRSPDTRRRTGRGFEGCTGLSCLLSSNGARGTATIASTTTVNWVEQHGAGAVQKLAGEVQQRVAPGNHGLSSYSPSQASGLAELYRPYKHSAVKIALVFPIYSARRRSLVCRSLRRPRFS